VVGNTATQLEVELLDRRNVGEDGHEQFAVDFLHVEEALGVPARIDADCLILERTPLRGQRVVAELKIEFAIAGAKSGAHFARREIQDLTLNASFHNRLARVGTVLQVRTNGFETILREPTGRRLEQVQTAGAGRSRSTEATELLVAGCREAATEIRRRQDGTKTVERIDPGLLGSRDRCAVVDGSVPGPVSVRRS